MSDPLDLPEPTAQSQLDVPERKPRRPAERRDLTPAEMLKIPSDDPRIFRPHPSTVCPTFDQD
jgi:hypothetical protein